METKQMRSFAAGLIVAASVCGAAYFLGQGDDETKGALKTPTVEEMKTKLTEDGYLVYTEEEFQSQLAAVQEAPTEEKPVEPKQEETTAPVEEAAPPVEQPKEETVKQTTLTVSQGMTSYDVGKVLVDLKIIDSAMGFVMEVDKRGVANKMRLGTYQFNSQMTIDEVIAMVFK